MRKSSEGIIVIPDVHGRGFWRKAVAKGRHIVFLGDYADPFPDEDISAEQALEELEAIISLKRSSPDKVTLLLGNHDLQYFWPEFPKTRYDSEHEAQYMALYRQNRDCFDLAASFLAPDRKVIFTHAGILPEWLNDNRTLFGLDDGPLTRGVLVSADVDRPNLYWRNGADALLCEALSFISTIRGGHSAYGSMVWADTREMMASPENPGVFQVFGHTQQHGGPLVTDSFACVDCREVFLLDKFGNISAMG